MTSSYLAFVPLPVCSRAAAARLSLLALGALLLGCGSSEGDPTGAAGSLQGAPLYASWAASPQDAFEALPFPGAPPAATMSLDDQTLRQVIRLSAGGDALRVQLSNLFGQEPVRIDAAAVALAAGGAAIEPATHVALTFSGAPEVTLPPGEERWSDVISFSTASESDLAVTLHVAGPAPLATTHSLGQQTAYLTPGNAVSAAELPSEDTRQAYYWLSRVEVRGPVEPRVIVAFGDSITDGFGSTPDASRRYPNYLSERLTAGATPASFSVVNAGISGNRVLTDVIGPSAVSRFSRDALGQAGVDDVILLIGINDIGFSGFAPEQEVSAEQITAGLSQMIDAAAAANVRVHLGTLLPFQGTMAPYYGDASEAKRQAVNAWIRANAAAASVVDFDRVMQDPANPLALQPALDSGDHLHPNDAGYATMAGAVDAAVFE